MKIYQLETAKEFSKKYLDELNVEQLMIDEICKKYVIKDYIINPDGSIDVDDNVNLYNYRLTKLPLKFNRVNGWFDCSDNNLISLKGSPKEVSVFFDCSNNNLITLEGSPIEINGSFYCNNNNLTSFEYIPKIIRGDFYCRFNNIKSFEYFPRFVKGDFWCDNNPIYEVWCLFEDTNKIELLNDFDIFRDEDTDDPSIIIDRLNDFLLTIGIETVGYVNGYKNIY